jgi:hypothetical protein
MEIVTNLKWVRVEGANKTTTLMPTKKALVRGEVCCDVMGEYLHLAQSNQVREGDNEPLKLGVDGAGGWLSWNYCPWCNQALHYRIQVETPTPAESLLAERK